MEEKQNDWLVTRINQPDFNLSDLNALGLDNTNTEFKDKDFYKSKDYFTSKFTDEDGTFNEELFDKFYDQSAEAFKALNMVKGQAAFLDRIETSYDNIFVSPNMNRKKDEFTLKKVKNGWKNIKGLEGLNQVTQSGLSTSEVAQANKLRDENGNKLDTTANDLGAFKTLFNKNTYVLDTYDEEGFHEDEDGRRVKHKKGDIKLDENGSPYYRALKSDEDVSMKTVLNWTDVVTEDGSYWNKWDIFDNDNLEQNITKSVMRGALKIAPLILGAPALGLGAAGAGIASTYAGTTAALSFAQSLPSIAKALDGIFNNGGDGKRNGLWKGMNTLQGFANRFQGSASEEAMSNPWAFENLLTMITDVGLQLSQQKFIAKIPQMIGAEEKMLKTAQHAQKQNQIFGIAQLRKRIDPSFNSEAFVTASLRDLAKAQGKNIDNYQKIVKGLSSTYMAITSVGDAWADAVNSGFDERTAGIVTMGTLAGLYSLMRYTDVGNWALNGVGITEARAGLKQGVNKGIRELSEAYTSKGLSETSKKAAEKNIFNKFKNISSDFVENLKNRPSDFLKDAAYGATAEGIEEVTEELIGDGVKVMANIGMFGKSEGNFEFSAKDIASRYALSFIGGMAGGAINVGIDHLNSVSIHGALNKDTREELEYLTYKYGAEAVKQDIEKRYQKGLMPVDNVLSVTKVSKNEDGSIKQELADNEEDTAAFRVKEALKNQIDSYASMLRGVTEDSFDNDVDKALHGSNRLSQIADLKKITSVKDDYMKIVSEYIDAKLEVAAANGSETNEQRARLNNAASEIDKFKAGEYFEHYAELGTFIMDEELSGKFIAKDKYVYSQLVTGKPYNELSEDEKNKVDSDFTDYETYDRTKQTKLAFNAFKTINGKYSNIIKNKFENFGEIRNITSDEFLDFDETFNRLQFSEDELTKLNDDKKYGIFDNLKLAKLEADTLDAVNEIEAKLSRYTQGVDSYLATILLDKIHAFNKVNDINYKKVDDDAKSFGKSIFGDDFKLPNSLSSIFDINPADYDENAFMSEIDKLQATDPEAEHFVDTSIFTDINRDALEELTYDSPETQAAGIDRDSDLTDPANFIAVKEYLKSLGQNIAGFVNPRTVEIGTKLKNIESFLQNQQVNPIHEMLDELGKITNSNYSGLLNILKEEDQRLKDAQNITDYVLDNNDRAQELDSLKNNILILRTLTNAAKTFDADANKDGFNYFTNLIRQKFGQNTEVLEMISDADAITVERDLSILENKIDYLLQLSRYNSGDKLRAHKKTAIKIQFLQHQRLKEILKKIQNNAQLPDDFRKIMNEEMNVLALDNDSHYLEPSSLQMLNSFDINDDETVAKFETIVTKYENQVFTNFNKYLKTKPANVSYDSLIKDIFGSLYSGDAMLQEKTSEMAETTDEISEYDAMNYFLTTVSVKSSNIKQLIKKLIDDGTFKYAPVYAQEYAARMAIARVLNPDIFNASLSYIKDLADKKGGYSALPLFNLTYIKGYHGSGKTSATLNLIDAFLNELGYTRTATSILDSQTENIKKSLGIDKGYNKSELLTLLGALDLKSIVAGNGVDLDQAKLDALIKNLMPANGVDPVGVLGNIIYIDEVTHYNSFELKFLSEFVRKTNRQLIVFGDRLQEGAKFNDKENNMEQMFKTQTPTLEFSMRSNNIHVKDNNNKMRAAASLVENMDYDKVSPSKIEKDYLANLAGMSFNYHRTNDSFTGNEITDNVTQADVDYLLSITETGTIGFIYDNENSPTFKLIDRLIKGGYDGKIKALKKDQVQGLEMDHFIIDVDLNYAPGSYLSHSKLLNTILSRSRHGSLIVKNGTQIKSEEAGYTRITEITDAELTNFKDSRSNVLEKVLAEAPADAIAPVQPTPAGNQGGQQAQPVQPGQQVQPGIIPPNQPAPVQPVVTGTTFTYAPNFDAKTNNAIAPYMVQINGFMNSVPTVTEELDRRKGEPKTSMIYTNINVLGAKMIQIGGADAVPHKSVRTVKNILPGSIEQKVIRDLSGFISEDAIYAEDVLDKAASLTRFRNAFMKYGSYDAIPHSIKQELLAKGTSGDSAIREDMAGSYDWNNGVVKFIVSKADDAIKRYNPTDVADPSRLILPQIVFEVESKIAGEPALQITLADLHNKSISEDFKSEIFDNSNRLLLKDGDEFTMIIPDLKAAIKSFSTGNRFIRHNSNAKPGELSSKHPVTRTLYDIMNDPGGLMISDPYIITNTLLGQELVNDTGEPLEQIGSGNAVIFVCTDPDLKNPDGSVVTKENLKDYYENYRIQEEENKAKGTNIKKYLPVVQWYRVGSRPLNPGEKLNLREYIENYNDARKQLGTKSSTDELRQTDTYYDPYNAARILFSIYQAYGTLTSAKFYKTITPQQEQVLNYLTKFYQYFSISFGYNPIFSTDGTGQLIGIDCKPSDVVRYADEDSKPKEMKIMFDSNDLGAKSRTKQLSMLFKKDRDKGYYDVMQALSDMLITPGQFQDIWTFSDADQPVVFDILEKILTTNATNYDPAGKKIVSMPDTKVFPNGIYLHPTMINSTKDESSYVRRMYINDHILKNMVLDVMPMGQQYILDYKGMVKPADYKKPAKPAAPKTFYKDLNEATEALNQLKANSGVKPNEYFDKYAKSKGFVLNVNEPVETQLNRFFNTLKFAEVDTIRGELYIVNKIIVEQNKIGIHTIHIGSYLAKNNLGTPKMDTFIIGENTVSFDTDTKHIILDLNTGNVTDTDLIQPNQGSNPEAEFEAFKQELTETYASPIKADDMIKKAISESQSETELNEKVNKIIDGLTVNDFIDKNGDLYMMTDQGTTINVKTVLLGAKDSVTLSPLALAAIQDTQNGLTKVVSSFDYMNDSIGNATITVTDAEGNSQAITITPDLQVTVVDTTGRTDYSSKNAKRVEIDGIIEQKLLPLLNNRSNAGIILRSIFKSDTELNIINTANLDIINKNIRQGEIANFNKAFNELLNKYC